MNTPESHFFWRHVFTEQEKKSMLPAHSGYMRTERLFSDLFDRLDFDDDLNKISLIDMKYFFIDDLMVKNDRSIMAHSVETRFPYMERDLVDFALRIPSRFKVKGLRGRCIQKEALRGLLPPQILRRSNMGLEMPHSLWFFGEFRAAAEDCFSRAHVERSGLLRHEEVARLWREHLERRRDNGRALWCVLNFLLWFDLFVHDRSYKRFLQGRG